MAKGRLATLVSIGLMLTAVGCGGSVQSAEPAERPGSAARAHELEGDWVICATPDCGSLTTQGIRIRADWTASIFRGPAEEYCLVVEAETLPDSITWNGRELALRMIRFDGEVSVCTLTGTLQGDLFVAHSNVVSSGGQSAAFDPVSMKRLSQPHSVGDCYCKTELTAGPPDAEFGCGMKSSCGPQAYEVSCARTGTSSDAGPFLRSDFACECKKDGATVSAFDLLDVEHVCPTLSWLDHCGFIVHDGEEPA